MILKKVSISKSTGLLYSSVLVVFDGFLKIYVQYNIHDVKDTLQLSEMLFSFFFFCRSETNIKISSSILFFFFFVLALML